MFDALYENIQVINKGHSIYEALSRAELDKIKKQLATPDIRPAWFDVTLEAWLHRISLWGKINITYKEPGKFRKVKLNQKQLIDLMTDSGVATSFGKWTIIELDINKLKFVRDFVNPKGKIKKQEFVLEIDLKKEIKNLLK